MLRPSGQKGGFQLPNGIVIDEKYLKEWVGVGLEEMKSKLEKHAAFDAWCAAHPTEETQQ